MKKSMMLVLLSVLLVIPLVVAAEEECLCEGYEDWSYDGICDPDDCGLCPDCLKVEKIDDKTATWGKENSGGVPTTLKLIEFYQNTNKARFQRESNGRQIYDKWFLEGECLVEGMIYCRVILKDIVRQDSYVDVVLESPSTKDEIKLKADVIIPEIPDEEPTLTPGGQEDVVSVPGELSDRIIMEDIELWRLVDSSMTTSGIGDISYMGTYEAQNPKAQAGFTRFFVNVIKPKQETAEEIFNNKKGTLGGREGKATKMVRLSNQYVNVVWFSGEYLIQIGPGTLEEIASNYIGGIEFLGDAYIEKYPSDVELKEACEQIGFRKEKKYCSDTGVYSDQKSKDEYCDNNFECRSNVCISSECIGESLMKKIINWFKRFFGA
ncbi:MAG: hypothetical protein QQN41_08235 [Nitrosopumilus sp.]